MKEMIAGGAGVLLLFCSIFVAVEYEHDAKMECAKFGMEQHYSASDIRSICWK